MIIFWYNSILLVYFRKLLVNFSINSDSTDCTFSLQFL